MAKRRVVVDLLLNARNFLDEGRRTRREVDELDDSFDELGDSVDDTEFSMRELAQTSRKSGSELGAFGSATKATAAKIKDLDDEMAAARVTARELAKEYAASNGDEAIGRRLDAQNRLIVSLHNERTELAKTKEVAGALGVTFGRAVVQTNEAAEALRMLDFRLAAARRSVRQLTIDFARTGDASTGKDLDSQRSVLSRLSRLRGDLVDLAVDGSKIGTAIGTNVMTGVGAGMNAGGPVLKVVLVAALSTAAAAASPVIGAIIAGAVTGGVGTAAMAAGLMAASRDPRVRAAASDVGNTLQYEFFDKGGRAFAQPAIDALRILEDAVEDMHLDQTFLRAAPAVGTVARGLADFGRNIMPGVNRALDRAGPLADAFAEGMGELGTHLGEFVDDLSDTPGAVEGVDTVFMALGVTLDGLGTLIKFLGDEYDRTLKRMIAGATVAAAIAEGFGFDEQADGYRRLAGALLAVGTNGAAVGGDPSKGIETFGESLEFAAMKAGDLSTAWDILHGKFATADETMLRAKEAIKEVDKAFDENGRSIAGNSEAALKNRIVLAQAAEAAAAAAESYYNLTGDAAGANRIMEEHRVLAEKATGATGAQGKAVHDLAVELFNLPPYVETKVAVNQVVTTRYVTTGNAPQINKNLLLEDRVLGGRASGGPVGPGLWRVGERGPEYLEMGPGQNGYVHPTAPWTAGAGAPGGWSAAGGAASLPPVNINVQLTDPLSGAVVRSQLITDALNRNQPQSVVAAAYP